MTLNFEEYKTKLYSAVLADTLDSLGYHKQTLTPGIKSIKPDVIICGLARVGLYMPIYHDDENTNVYEHEIALIDSLKENEIAVLCCHGNEKIAPWGELLSTRATYLKSAGCLTDGCVREHSHLLNNLLILNKLLELIIILPMELSFHFHDNIKQQFHFLLNYQLMLFHVRKHLYFHHHDK